MDDTSEPIVTAFFYVLDLILFLSMVSGVILMMRVGNQVNENAKNSMVDRDILTSQVNDDEKNRYLRVERDANGNRAVNSTIADINNPQTEYDGMLTGEEVINAILAMRYYHDAFSTTQRSANGAYFDTISGEICPIVTVVAGSRVYDLGEISESYQGKAMSVIRYAQEVNLGKINTYISTDPGFLYKRTYRVYDDRSGNPDQKAIQKQIIYTRVTK